MCSILISYENTLLSQFSVIYYLYGVSELQQSMKNTLRVVRSRERREREDGEVKGDGEGGWMEREKESECQC